MTALACPSCGRSLPEAAAPGLARRLVEALGERPEGATTRELVSLVGRRFDTVTAALSELEAQGLVERFDERRGRAWNAKPWRLAQKAPGVASGQRQSGQRTGSDLPPALGELGAMASLGAASGCESVAASYAFLIAAGLFVVGLVLEARVAVLARLTRTSA